MINDVRRGYLETLRAEIAAMERRLAERQAQIDELQQQQVEEQGQLAEARRVERYVLRTVGEPATETPTSDGVVSDDVPGVTLRRDHEVSTQDADYPELSHGDVVEEVLREAGRPLTTIKIVEALRAKGQPLPDDPNLRDSAIHEALRRREGKTVKQDTWGRWVLIEVSTGSNGDNARCTPLDKITYAEAADILIKQTGRPVKTSEIADWMIRKGYKDISKRKFICNSIYNSLKNSGRFQRIRGEKWDLADAGTRDQDD